MMSIVLLLCIELDHVVIDHDMFTNEKETMDLVVVLNRPLIGGNTIQDSEGL